MSDAELLIDGKWQSGTPRELSDHFTGRAAGIVHLADPEQVKRALDSARRAADAETLHPADRADLLLRAAQLVDQHRDHLAELVVADTGFPVKDARGEVTRAIQTLRRSSEEATRLTGEIVPLDSAPGVRKRIGFTIRVPVGVVVAITPFNSPLNTVCHKVAPALAAGNTVILKAASPTPRTASALGRILLDAGLPATHLQVLHGAGQVVGQILLTDTRPDFYTFTGSTPVGEHIRRTVGLRRVQLELGAISPTIVLADADIDAIASPLARSSFRKAGQVCTSVQRLIVEHKVIHELTEAVLSATRSLALGDPRSERTDVGPMISLSEAARVIAWVTEAVSGGAQLLCGGERDGALVQPTVLTNVTRDAKVIREEVFGPVVVIEPAADPDEAVARANDSEYGLAAGIFTRDVSRGLDLAQRLRMGSVYINDTSSSRVDLMPYGGVKRSGYGKEGPRYAAREMTEERLVTISYG